jgi:hypothetical protein
MTATGSKSSRRGKEGKSMALADITRNAILGAINEYDRLGRDEFLRTYGFGHARTHWLIHDGKDYDSKAIVGVAHGFLPEKAPLAYTDFGGGETTVVPLLGRLGFVVRSEPGEGDTEREAEAEARALETECQRLAWLRQHIREFSHPVRQYWNCRCALTGIEARQMLEACHTKPWSESTENVERLNTFNGLYLAAHIHAAFDGNLLGIKPDATIVFADNLSRSDRKKLRLAESPKIGVTEQNQAFLEHRYSAFLAAQ